MVASVCGPVGALRSPDEVWPRNLQEMSNGLTRALDIRNATVSWAGEEQFTKWLGRSHKMLGHLGAFPGVT